MARRAPARAVVAVLAVLGAAALVLVGRASVDLRPSAEGQRPGYDAGYTAGLLAGTAAGRAEGRALQVRSTADAGVGASVEAAFRDGYAAGANDVFSGYDGGWRLGTPYVVTLARGAGAVTYRVATRAPLLPGSTCVTCPERADGVCVVPSP